MEYRQRVSNDDLDISPDESPDVDERSEVTEARTGAVRGDSGRRKQSIALIVVAALLAPLTLVAAWARAQIEDTDRYVATVAPRADDPDIQAYVATALADTVYELLGVEELLDESLPDELAQLGPVIGPAIRGSLGDAAERFTTSPAFTDFAERWARPAQIAVGRSVSWPSSLATIRTLRTWCSCS